MVTIDDMLNHISDLEMSGTHPHDVWMGTMRFLNTFLEPQERAKFGEAIQRECPALLGWLVNGPDA